MADQIFVTHCLQNDSVKNQTGYGIRATSTDNADLLKFAAEYPAYELPLDMQVNDPAPLQAPRRLAMLPAPGGKMALIHSAYVGEDTMGRSGNFFSHIVIFRALTAAQALESWCAAEWRTSYPIGAPKRLLELSERPFVGSVINAGNLSSFLSGQGVGKDPNLATRVCPAQLTNDAERCRTLQLKMLDGFLAASNADPARGRLYFVGEPGLIALLLYGVAKLLPAEAAAKMSFSTFENPKALRQLKLTFASATFASDPQKALDSDYYRTRGFGFDACPPDRSSPEIPAEPSIPAKEFVRLAAANKWSSILQLHECHFAGRVSPTSLGASFRTYNLRNKARRNELTPEELLEFHNLEDGEALIQNDDKVFWPLIVRFSSVNEAVCKAFAKLLRTRADELVAEAGMLLGKCKPQWADSWGLVKKVGAADERRAGMLLNQADAEAPNRPYLAEFRVPLLQVWQQVCASPASIPAPIRDFLALNSAEAFALLQRAGLPAEWLAYSLDVGLSAHPAAAWAIEAVTAAPDRLLQAFIARLHAGKSFDDSLKKLNRLIPDPASYPFLFRLAKAGLSIPPEAVQTLLASLGETPSTLSSVWWRGDNVETILTCMVRYKERAAPIWEHFWRFINKELLYGHPGQKALFDNLTSARAKCPACVSAACAEFLDDWATLLRLFQRPSETSVSPQQIESICEQRQVPNPSELLKEFFRKVIQEKPTDSSEMQTFATTFDKVYPAASTNDDHMTRFDAWQALLYGVKGPKKMGDLQFYFLDKLVPLKSRLDIAKAQGDLIDHAVLDRLAKSVANQTPKLPVAAVASPIPAATRVDNEDDEADELVRGARYYLELTLASVVGLGIGVMAILLFHIFSGPLPRSRQDTDFFKLENTVEALKKEATETKMTVKAEYDSKDSHIEKLKSDLRKSASAMTDKEKKLTAARDDVKKKAREYSILQEKFNVLEKDHRALVKKPPTLPKDNVEALHVGDIFTMPEKSINKSTEPKVDKLDIKLVSQPKHYFKVKPDTDKRGCLVVLVADENKCFLSIRLTDQRNGVDVTFNPKDELKKSDTEEAVRHLSDVVIVISSGSEVVRQYKLIAKDK